MGLAELKKKLIEIATCFYQQRNNDGMGMFMEVMETVVTIPEFKDLMNPLFEAVEAKDYVLAADIFYHEMAMCIQ